MKQVVRVILSYIGDFGDEQEMIIDAGDPTRFYIAADTFDRRPGVFALYIEGTEIALKFERVLRYSVEQVTI